MHRYVLRRALLIVPVLLAAYTVTFLLIQSSPGSPWDSERRLTPEQRANLNARYGLDRPIWVQYTTYLANVVLHLDFGESFTSKGQQVRTIVAERLPVVLGNRPVEFNSVQEMMVSGPVKLMVRLVSRLPPPVPEASRATCVVTLMVNVTSVMVSVLAMPVPTSAGRKTLVSPVTMMEVGSNSECWC